MTEIYILKTNSNALDNNELSFDPKVKHETVQIGQPTEIGHFSIDSSRNIHFDKSQMKYLIPFTNVLEVNYDLSINFKDDVTHRYVTIEKIHQMLYWLSHHRNHLIYFAKLRRTVDFVTVRGAIVLIMCTPYLEGHYKNKWTICASKIDGIIYFAAIDTDDDIDSYFKPKQSLYQAWGYKFEQYMTTDKIGGSADLSNRRHQFEEYCVIMKNVLGSHTLLYKAEMDAAVPEEYLNRISGDISCYRELKTRIQSHESQGVSFKRYKLIQWWAQSYIAGVPEIICGFRTDDGFVKELKQFIVDDIPSLCSEHWSANSCLSFCNLFLNHMKKTVIDEDPRVVYRFDYNNNGIIRTTKLVDPIPRYRIIPEWYRNK